MHIQFLGHSCFYIEEGNFQALIDPFLSSNPLASFKPSEFHNISHIFVTHVHNDHLGDTLMLARENNATVITNYEIACYLESKGLSTHPMHIGGRVKLDFGIVKMTSALHGSSIQTANGLIYAGNPCGFILDINGKKIYHAGDTGLTMDMQLLQNENIDIALLPIGGNFTMDIEDAVRAVEFIQPKKVIPMHYNTFPIIEADPMLFREKVHHCEVILLKPNDSYNIL
jgi:L-ascorbate metabolism protein UlaG (beta-lactamase superfamily)